MEDPLKLCSVQDLMSLKAFIEISIISMRNVKRGSKCLNGQGFPSTASFTLVKEVSNMVDPAVKNLEDLNSKIEKYITVRRKKEELEAQQKYDARKKKPLLPQRPKTISNEYQDEEEQIKSSYINIINFSSGKKNKTVYE